MRRCLLIIAVLLSGGCTTSPAPSAIAPSTETGASENRMIVVTVHNDQTGVAARAGSTLRGYESGSHYSADASARAAADGIAKTYHLRPVSAWPIVLLHVHCIMFEIPADADISRLLDILNHDARVESAQPLHEFKTLSTEADNSYRSLQRNVQSMEVLQAHRWSKGAGVRIAVIDTGVDFRHPDLAGRIVEHRNFIDDDDWTFSHDRHGTAVAGVIAAASDATRGIIGIAPEAHIYAYKACRQLRPDSALAVCDSFTLAKAIAAAIDARAQVVNLSLGGPSDPLLRRLIEKGLLAGIMFVGAMPPGVNGTNFPCDIDGVIAVASTEFPVVRKDALLAPGLDLLTLTPEGHYDFASGSSLAAANVSGAIALLLARERTLSGMDARQLLETTANRISAAQAYAGINACAALSSLLHEAPCTPL